MLTFKQEIRGPAGSNGRLDPQYPNDDLSYILLYAWLQIKVRTEKRKKKEYKKELCG